MIDNKEPKGRITHEEAITEIWGKLNEVIDKVNKIGEFLENLFGELKKK